MHKIVAGVANRSYGIQVAKMAGMPASVVSRAEDVLAALESNDERLCEEIKPFINKSEGATGNKKETKVSQSQNVKTQLNLFG